MLSYMTFAHLLKLGSALTPATASAVLAVLTAAVGIPSNSTVAATVRGTLQSLVWRTYPPDGSMTKVPPFVDSSIGAATTTVAVSADDDVGPSVLVGEATCTKQKNINNVQLEVS